MWASAPQRQLDWPGERRRHRVVGGSVGDPVSAGGRRGRRNAPTPQRQLNGPGGSSRRRGVGGSDWLVLDPRRGGLVLDARRCGLLLDHSERG